MGLRGLVSPRERGTNAAADRIARVLWNDPATGVVRHADAGYGDAIACAREYDLNVPGILYHS